MEYLLANRIFMFFPLGLFFPLRSLPCAFSRQLAFMLVALFFVATPWRRDPAGSKQLSTVAVLGFQFGLYHVVVALSFLRSISCALLYVFRLFVF